MRKRVRKNGAASSEAAKGDESKAHLPGAFTSLAQVMGELVYGGGLPIDLDDARIWRVWEEVVGEEVGSVAQPLWIRDGVLRVGVSEPIWLHDLRYSAREIAEALNGRLGRKRVLKVDFRLHKASPGEEPD